MDWRTKETRGEDMSERATDMLGNSSSCLMVDEAETSMDDDDVEKKYEAVAQITISWQK